MRTKNQQQQHDVLIKNWQCVVQLSWKVVVALLQPFNSPSVSFSLDFFLSYPLHEERSLMENEDDMRECVRLQCIVHIAIYRFACTCIEMRETFYTFASHCVTAESTSEKDV